MSDKIYTDDRKKKAQALFAKAKRSIIAALGLQCWKDKQKP